MSHFQKEHLVFDNFQIIKGLPWCIFDDVCVHMCVRETQLKAFRARRGCCRALD